MALLQCPLGAGFGWEVLGIPTSRSNSRGPPCPISCPAGAVRASSIFPILSVGLLFFGGLCVAASEFYKSKHNVILSAGIFFVSAGRSCLPGSGEGGPPGAGVWEDTEELEMGRGSSWSVRF